MNVSKLKRAMSPIKFYFIMYISNDNFLLGLLLKVCISTFLLNSQIVCSIRDLHNDTRLLTFGLEDDLNSSILEYKSAMYTYLNNNRVFLKDHYIAIQSITSSFCCQVPLS